MARNALPFIAPSRAEMARRHAPHLAARAVAARKRIRELETALQALADALQDEIESNTGRELTARDLPREWHAARALTLPTA